MMSYVRRDRGLPLSTQHTTVVMRSASNCCLEPEEHGGILEAFPLATRRGMPEVFASKTKALLDLTGPPDRSCPVFTFF